MAAAALGRRNYSLFLLPRSLFSCVNASKAGKYVHNVLVVSKRDRGHQKFPDRSLAPTLRELNKRRERIRTSNELREIKDVPKRSEFLEWNYDAEIFAFGIRLGEPVFDGFLLREAFRTESGVKVEEEKHKKLGLKLPPGALKSNEELSKTGRIVIERTLKGYFRSALPYLPEEGIEAFTKYLTRPEMLYHVSFHIGTKDLIVSKEYPPSVETMAEVFCAVIGAHAQSVGDEGSEIGRTEKLVIDLLAAQMSGGVDLKEVWDVEDPMKLLSEILKKEQRGPPEARLLWASGPGTILASYHVGIYSDKELVGQCSGETPETAEEMAARDALSRIFQINDSRTPLPFTERQLKNIKLKQQSNLPVKKYSRQNIVRLP